MALIIGQLSCVSLSSDDDEKVLTAKTPIPKLVNAAVVNDGDKLQRVLGIMKEEKLQAPIKKELETILRGSLDNLSPVELVRATQLYQASTRQFDHKVLTQLIRHKDAKVMARGWALSSLSPSPKMAQLVEREVSIYVVKNQESKILVPELATTIRTNQITSLFSILRLGLLNNGSDEFAKAMSELNPGLASEPFMDYLALSDLEDLRQINQTAINPYTSFVIMRHFLANPLPISHNNIGHIFLYAISRNPALADLAKSVLEQQIPRNRDHLAYTLATQPVEVQIAFIESTRRNPSANFKLLLEDLRRSTRFDQVVEEINSIRIF